MKSLDTLAVTTATASALSKATESINNAHTTEAKANLRISNIEKAIRRQENTTNEIVNKIKRTPQKNYSGSHNSEHMASPVELALKLNKKRQNQKLVDLTLDASQESKEEKTTSFQKNLRKENLTKKQKKRKLSPPQKKVQWGDVEVQNFDKGQTMLRFSSPHFPHQTHFTKTTVSQPPFFTPAPPPAFLASPYPNQPNIQANPLFTQMHTPHKPSKQPNSRLLVTTWANTEPVLPQFSPTKAIRTFEGIPLWKMKQNFNLTTKTNPNSKKSTVPQDSSKETKKSRRIIQRRKNRYIKREIKN